MIDQWEKQLLFDQRKVLSLLCEIYSCLEVKTLVQLWMSQIQFGEDPGNSASDQLICNSFYFPDFSFSLPFSPGKSDERYLLKAEL